jgi:hypothetical protein
MFKVPTALSLFALITLLPVTAAAQHEAFLRCADFSEREARVQCLEAALEQALRNNSSPSATTVPSASANSTTQTATVDNAPPIARQTTKAEEPKSKSFELFGLFNRDNAPEPSKALEIMQATITDLKFYKPDVWTITLDNGQIWRQLYSKRYGLRVNDAIKIYKPDWAEQFRLEAERFNGFIQIERLQ